MKFSNLYKNTVIEKPKFILSILIILLLSFTYFSKNFQLDASSDTLLLENDPDLNYLREVNKKYGSKDFLILTYTHEPSESFKSENTIKNVALLKNSLENLDWVNNVITILDVPLLKNNDDPLAERIKNFKTLSNADVDLDRGFEEIINSPIYKDFVISSDGKTSGILVYIKSDKKLTELTKTKNDYLERKVRGELTSKEKSAYKTFLKNYDSYKKVYNKKNHENINEIRKIIKDHPAPGKVKRSSSDMYPIIHLGGIPMIADDMITFIKNDLIMTSVIVPYPSSAPSNLEVGTCSNMVLPAGNTASRCASGSTLKGGSLRYNNETYAVEYFDYNVRGTFEGMSDPNRPIFLFEE